MAAATAAVQSLINRRLYRSLLRASRPFSLGSPDAVVLTCLLHRTGLEDEGWDAFLRDNQALADEAPSDRQEGDGRSLFQKLLREVVCAGDPDGIRQMVFPRNVEVDALNKTIRREFRGSKGDASVSAEFDSKARRAAAFAALRELNRKLAWADNLRRKAPKVHPQQAARDVAPLPTHPPSAYLKPGAYLISHPNMSGYFRRTVICILDHKEEGTSGEDDGTAHGTYGLIVNRLCRSSPHSDKSLTLEEVLRPLPPDLAEAFGSALVKEGGPVQMSLQMLHCATPEQEELKIGGHPLSVVPDEHQTQSTAVHSDRAIYYKGDIMNAAGAVVSGRLDRDDVSFFVGASSWSVGQLESEIERGCWLPCRGPTEIAHTGICDHVELPPTVEGEKKVRPKADLWLSMLSALGDDEAELAHLTYNNDDDGEDELGAPCDDDYAAYLVSFKD